MKFHYKVMGFLPPSKPLPGTFGFGILLDGDFAIKPFNTKIEDVHRENLMESGRYIVNTLFREDGLEFSDTDAPYLFLDDSCLLRVCMAPGNACDLAVEGNAMGDFMQNPEQYSGRWIDYGPHNVDTLKQSYTLFSLWNDWYTSISETIDPSF